MKTIRKVGLAVFRDKKMIMLRDNRNDKVFYLAGGTVESGETDMECLHREIREELDTEIDPSTIKFLSEFEAPAHGKENTLVSIRLFQGELLGEPKPSQEIVEIAYFDSSVSPEHLSAVTFDEIFPWLKERGLIA